MKQELTTPNFILVTDRLGTAVYAVVAGESAYQGICYSREEILDVMVSCCKSHLELNFKD